jgi:hypothetical protein
MRPSDGTVRPAVAVEAWTSLVLGGLGLTGLALLAAGPFIVAPGSFPALPLYAFTLGGLLVVAAATMRLRSLLIVFGFLGLAAGLALGLLGKGDPVTDRAALTVYCGAAVVLGAAARRTWAAVPFLLVPLLIVAPGPIGWTGSRLAFADAWTTALACACPWAGLPAALAVAGAFIGRTRERPWVPVRPSALPLLLMCAGLALAGVIVASIVPAALGFADTVALRAALIAGVLGWVALAYQAGRFALAWQTALACVLVLAGAMAVDNTTDPLSIDAAFAATLLAALLPAILAGVGLLVRKWVGTEQPRFVQAPAEPSMPPRPVEAKGFFAPAPTPEAVLPTPLSGSAFQPPPEPKKKPEQDDAKDAAPEDDEPQP